MTDHTLPAAAIPVGAIVQEEVPYRVTARRFADPREGRMVLVDEANLDHAYGANERLTVSELPPMPLPKDWGKNDLKPRPRRGGGEMI
jgi:hypothetical protein